MPTFLDTSDAPRSIVTLAEAIDECRGDLGLRGSSLVTDDDVTRWLNRGQDRLAQLLRWFRTAEVMGTTADQKEYALPAPATGRCIQIEEIRYDNQQLQAITFNDLIRVDWNYQSAGTGQPDWYYLRGNTGFGLHLTPSVTDADILTVLYVALPPHLSADDELFFCPHGGEEYIITYAKLRASEKDIYGEGARRVDQFRADLNEALIATKRNVDQVSDRERVVRGSDSLDEGYAGDRVPFHTSWTNP